jgi:hypothetical protein
VKWAVLAKDAAAKNRRLTVAVFVGWDGVSERPGTKSPEAIHWWNDNCSQLPGLKAPYFVEGETKNGSDVLVGEQLFLSSEIALVQAEATRFSDVVALFQALGGGWWNQPDNQAKLAAAGGVSR